MDENDAYGIAMTQVSCGYWLLANRSLQCGKLHLMQARASDSSRQSVSRDEVQYEEIDPNTIGFTISTNSAYSIVHP